MGSVSETGSLSAKRCVPLHADEGSIYECVFSNIPGSSTPECTLLPLMDSAVTPLGSFVCLVKLLDRVLIR
jgi:hypothetical protein